jgi:hypothetical protein
MVNATWNLIYEFIEVTLARSNGIVAHVIYPIKGPYNDYYITGATQKI